MNAASLGAQSSLGSYFNPIFGNNWIQDSSLHQSIPIKSTANCRRVTKRECCRTISIIKLNTFLKRAQRNPMTRQQAVRLHPFQRLNGNLRWSAGNRICLRSSVDEWTIRYTVPFGWGNLDREAFRPYIENWLKQNRVTATRSRRAWLQRLDGECFLSPNRRRKRTSNCEHRERIWRYVSSAHGMESCPPSALRAECFCSPTKRRKL